MKYFTFVVSGKGHFPHDMLRYDFCWPHTTSDAIRVETMSAGRRGEPRDITLASNRRPTPERWLSFGWSLDQIREHQ